MPSYGFKLGTSMIYLYRPCGTGECHMYQREALLETPTVGTRNGMIVSPSKVME